MIRKSFTEKLFQTEDACLQFIAKLKWPSVTKFECYECGCNSYCKGQKPYSRECLSCGYDESPTANTAFHKMHLPLIEAFFVVEQIAKQTVFDMFNYSTEWLAPTIKRSKTKHSARRRIQQGLSNYVVKIEDEVDIEIIPVKDIVKFYKGDELLILAVKLGADNFSYDICLGEIIDILSTEAVHDFLKKYVSSDAAIDIYCCPEFPEVEATHPDTMFHNAVRYEKDSYETLPYIKGQLRSWLKGFNYRVNLESVKGALNEFFSLWNSYIKCEDALDNYQALFNELLIELSKRRKVK
jgi:hypothetical protein